LNPEKPITDPFLILNYPPNFDAADGTDRLNTAIVQKTEPLQVEYYLFFH